MLFSPDSEGTSAAFTPSSTGRSRAQIVPSEVGINPLIALNRVDLPEPL